MALLREVAEWWSLYPLLIVAAAGLASVRSSRTLQLCSAFVAATALCFIYVGGDFLEFFGPRFLMPALPFLLLLACEGLSRLSRWTVSLRSGGDAGRGARGSGWVAAAGAAILLANALCFSWPARHGNLEALAEQMESWEELGRWISTNTPAGAVVATGGAGIVPYYSRRATIDMYGLADLHIGHMTPLASGFKKVAHEKYDPAYVLDRKPDLLISGVDRNGVPRTAGLPRARDRVWACYRPVLFLNEGPAGTGRHLLPAEGFSPALVDAGYRIALWERRRGPDVGRCALFDRSPTTRPLAASR
jgi:hypothetical protein